MYLEVESQALVRKGVQRLQGILDWCGGSVRSRWYGYPPSIQVSLLYARAEEPHAPTGGASKDASGSPTMPRAPRTKEPLNQVQTVFLHYIATGVLPVTHSQYTLSDMQQQLLEQFQKTPHFFGAPSGGSVFSDQLLDLLLTNKCALPRLLAQFGEALLEDLYAHTMESGIVSRWTGWLSDVPGMDTRTLRWKTLLLSLSYTGGRMSLDNYPKVEKGIVLYLLREMQPAQLFRWVGQLPNLKFQKLLGALDITYGASIDLSELLSLIQEQIGQLVPAEKPAPPALSASDAVTYVDNAGLILLHPFLFPLFQELGWVDPVGFVQENLHQRAVLLTQYLARPSDIIPEYQLRLNKLLCGYPLESTLPLSLDEEASRLQEKAAQLLQTVIRQWTFNGQPVNHHIQHLRDSFLLRRGKLIRREHDWLLQVEQKAFDVMLNGLPWNMRMIQLPWMKEVLWVEWV